MSVILKKDEKVSAVISSSPKEFSYYDYISQFKLMYPSDWTKIVKNHAEQSKDAKPRKSVPMPKPEQYLINALNVWNNKKSHR